MPELPLKVLILGGTGRVGRMLRRHWTVAPPHAMTLTWQSRHGAGDPIWDAADGAAALARHGPFDRLLVLAGITPGHRANLDRNAEIARICAEAAALTGAAHLLLASSSAIYGTVGSRPCREDDAPRPASPYAKAKLDAERALLDRAGGPPACALRIGNVLGADALMLNAVRASDGDPLHLDSFADGHGPLRSYIGPATLARALETLLRKGPALPGVLNLAAPAPVAMQSLLEAAGTPYVKRPAPPEAVQTVTLDCTALTALHPFAGDASDAARMIAEWRRVRDAA